MLHAYPTDKMNAYPISPKIADKSLSDKSLIMPVGKLLFEESSGFKSIKIERNC